MNNAGLTYKHTINVGDNYGIISSYINYCNNVKSNNETHPKTTLFETKEKDRGKRKRNKTGKED